MLPTFASYGSDTDSDTQMLTRPLLVKTKKARAGLALLSATLVMTSGAGVYGMFDATAMCQVEGGAVLESTTNLAAILPRPSTTGAVPTIVVRASDTQQLFDRIDVDGSGAVNLTELVAFLERERDNTIHAMDAATSTAIQRIKDEYFYRAQCVADGFNAMVQHATESVGSPDELALVVRWVQQHCSAFFPELATIPTTTTTTIAPTSKEEDGTLFSRDDVVAFVKNKTSSTFFLQCTVDALDQVPPVAHGLGAHVDVALVPFHETVYTPGHGQHPARGAAVLELVVPPLQTRRTTVFWHERVNGQHHVPSCPFCVVLANPGKMEEESSARSGRERLSCGDNPPPRHATHLQVYPPPLNTKIGAAWTLLETPMVARQWNWALGETTTAIHS
ncbi:hypothetical protein DYB32_007952 [Aphanomyces invadans]|uniref:EF-hand domain-containing protein n=1 Tax=Aphanomyces invadans TaxID=157072 RepID=A0A3R6VST6_9STRA|nr:hypothetical protein DYB32_007952 [Aphanomyces invadans]